MSVKHCITFVHSSSTLRPHAITSELFPIPCLTLVYRAGVTRSATPLLSIFHSFSPLLTSNTRLSPLTWVHAYKRALKHKPHTLIALKHTQAHCKLATHSGNFTHGQWACGGFDVSRSLPFITAAALVSRNELWPSCSSQHTHTRTPPHANTPTFYKHIERWESELKLLWVNSRGGRRKWHGKCLCQLPAKSTFGTGKVWFDGFAC